MSLHIVTGAGSTGIATARQLADSGERVRIVSRSGRGPEHPLIERVAADITDVDRLTELLTGARTLYNCAAPAYDRWREEFPPLAEALLTAAARTGTDYVMLGNIYGYGIFEGGTLQPDQPMAPTTDKGRVRADMWLQALAAHEAGRVRVTEIRASDYLGADAASLFNLMVAPQVLTGEQAVYPADLDVAHSWTYIGDVARTLVAAANSDAVWGRGWFVPSVADVSARELAGRLAEVADAPAARIERMSDDLLTQLAAENAVMAEIVEMRYLNDRDCVLDASETVEVLGVKPAVLDDVLRETVDAVRSAAVRSDAARSDAARSAADR